MQQIKVCLVGATGRMGYEVIASALRNNVQIIGGIAGSNDPLIGKEIEGVTGRICDTWEKRFDEAQSIIDFSSASGAKLALEAARANKIPVIICSTGLSGEFDTLFSQTASVVPVIKASNTSIGVNSMLKILDLATRLLGESYDVEIMEIHHRHKKDAPSGTALSLAGAIAQAKGKELSQILREPRVGDDALRLQGELGVCALRGGDVPGEHTVFYFGEGERIEITHRATKRAIFADGAIRAATWLANAKARGITPGMYTMQDVISF